MNTCVMCGTVMISGNHVCKYCIDEVNKETSKKLSVQIKNSIVEKRSD